LITRLVISGIHSGSLSYFYEEKSAYYMLSGSPH
jgi:hypothetical protein